MFICLGAAMRQVTAECRATLVHLTEQVKHADAAFLETAAQIRRKFERA
jgi:hypothetical protein